MALRFVQFMIICVLALATYKRVLASDPDILSYYIVQENNKVDANSSTYTGFQDIFDDVPGTLNIMKAALAEFPALNGQNVSYAMLKYPANKESPPHTHPHAAELLFLVCSLEVGFVDTKNVLYTQKLKVEDLFVFPKGLVHCQYNSYANLPAYADSAFGSANAGTVSVLIYMFVFGTGIDNAILAKSLKTDVGTKRSSRLASPLINEGLMHTNTVIFVLVMFTRPSDY
ncbi:PREDICTED: putative germin-like protein 9-2 [Prunus mume]|uniref:Germin-like protein n=1 Tax=Prunus mume TaxID=102107 RepID=A0ABM1LQI2_PRUMU|nr:PREDICTED: putative germin-like protein 9-2 [Prunus mume]